MITKIKERLVDLLKGVSDNKVEFYMIFGVVLLITLIAILEFVIYLNPDTLLKAVGSIWFG